MGSNSIHPTWESHWPRVYGLQSSTVLKWPRIHLYVLVGIPGYTRQQSHEQTSTWVPHFDWPGFPLLREDVLPPNLTRLKIEMSRDTITPSVVDCSGCESLLGSVLSSPMGLKLCLKVFMLGLPDIACLEPLPLNFWNVQKQCHCLGVRLDYELDCEILTGGTYTFPNHVLERVPTGTYGDLCSIEIFAATS